MTPAFATVALATTSAAALATPIGFVAAAVATGFAAVEDARHERVPNRLLALALVAVATAALFGPVWAVLAGALLAGTPLLVVLLTRGIGMGDVKLATVLGATGGLLHPGIGLGGVFLAAAVSGTYARLRHVERLALGPWLWSGFVLATAATAPLWWSS